MKLINMVTFCIICKSNCLNADVSTHTFPKDPEKYLLWLNAINKTTVSKNARLCSKHFEAKFYRYGLINQRRFLLPTAVPTLYLCTASNSQLTEGSNPQVHVSFDSNNTNSNTVCLKTNEHEEEPMHDKSVLTHTMKTSDMQDELCNEEQMLLQNKMGRMENTEEESEGSKLIENPVCKKIKEVAQNRKRNDYPGQIGVYPKRMRYVGDVDWNVICHTPSEAKYYGMASVKEMETLRKELNYRTEKIRRLKRKMSTLQSLITQLKQVANSIACSNAR